MKSAFTVFLCRFLAVAVLMLPFQLSQASMIGVDQVNSTATAQADREVVVSYLTRSQTVSDLQALGLDAQTAKDRVASMTDNEVGTLAGKITAAPAGGDGTGVLLFILVVGVVWYFAFRR